MDSREIGTFEMLWDCPRCGTKGLLGKSNRQCPNCGGAQDPTARYFPPEGQEKTAVNHTFDGADKVCPACLTPNGAKSNNCRNCGARLEGASAVVTREAVMAGGGTSPIRPQQALVTDSKPAGCLRWKPSSRSCLLGLLIFGLLLAAVLYLGRKKESTATVLDHRWSRVINIERLTPRNDSEWCANMPSDAYDVHRKREARTREVADGQDCTKRNIDNGDGTFRQVEDCKSRYRTESYTDDRCYYSVNRWSETRALSSSGAGTSPLPAWPQMTLKTGSCAGCEREKNRKDIYITTIKVGKEQYPCEVPEKVWQSLSDGSTTTVKIWAIDGKPDCGSLGRRP
ncbi:MAG TPA: hypothetical protein VHL58_02445 [Thermoanaerobaculia bacterium]|nr:hypothetical protein [Thermoanaerobaculia bacterium]